MRNGPYELIVAPEKYPGKRYCGRYAYEHVVVFWKNKGFVPSQGYEIHHLNGDHRDNRIENLQLLTSKEHRSIHRLKPAHRPCELCKEVFYGVESRQRFCSRECSGKNSQNSSRRGK